MLLVEDDPGHARLSERNLRRVHITNEIMTLRDGQKAIDYLFEEGLRRPTLLLLLLDLNLPGRGTTVTIDLLWAEAGS